MECVTCVCVWLGVERGVWLGEWMREFGCGGVGGVGWEWVGGLDQGREQWGGVMSVCGVGLDFLCRWQVQVSVYCACRNVHI